MLKSERSKEDGGNWFHSDDLPNSSGVYFYLILFVSFVLPVVVTVSVIFTDLVVTGILTALLLFVLVFLIRTYRRLKRELREFDETLDRLHLIEGACEISLMGGLLNIHIEEPNTHPRALPHLPEGCEGTESN